MSFCSVVEIAGEVRAGRVTARAVTEATLSRIQRLDGGINAFTAVTAERALAAAEAVDADLAAGRPVGPLAGVPFAVKNLFDLEGLPTLAGSKIRRAAAPPAHDATLVQRLTAAGAVLVGALNMDEFAYGFVTENAHDGPVRNPHDPTRIAGGSSGGSAAAVAAGLVPLTLGSDTNGSIRIPAGLCGVFGLKPTYGRLSRQGVFPFVESLDHVGPFARSVEDLALAYDVLQGPDPSGDPICIRDAEPLAGRLDALAEQPLRVGVLGGWFQQGAFPEVLAALGRVADALEARDEVTLQNAQAARAAAFCLTAFEGGELHHEDLARRAMDYDPAVRDRLLAGALLPAGVAEAAKRFRTIFRDEVREVFQRYDILLAPASVCPAPPIGQATMEMDGVPVSVRKNLGAFTQPISYVGLPVLAAPVNRPGQLPIGVQIIAPPWREDLAFAAALRLQRAGVVAAHPPTGAL
ncbi:AtzE family amidohydrolase [Caulobacter vibrioides]|uniref:AtzE family amidohydrolase n=1 Tax=Caulobacter vibrioides TaxID=155892 RepID=UPI000BB45AC6|nr:AtzE family amidohydrolase [Caulobacter vibrioides]ATC25597.1 AtzE family amidohydrolase [Caulobacter vibrioides]AZH13687.1 AtzE family amidohydrolase [Caulobacter vibrioides]PLR14559.1 amidase [Caulobacter vibrioides]